VIARDGCPAEPAESNQHLLWPELPSLLGAATDVERVEVKAILAPGHAAPEVLGADPVCTRVHQVYYLDTPDLRLYERGAVLRLRRSRRGADAVVKLRMDASGVPGARPRGDADLVVEVDALPGSCIRSASLKRAVDPAAVLTAVAGRRPPCGLLSSEQRAVLEAAAGDVDPDDLEILGPVTVHRLPAPRLCPGGRTVIEAWHYPDGSRVVEISAKCPPSRAVHDAAVMTRALVARHVALSAEQATKTHRTLVYFAAAADGRGRSS
jgi:hypothetical protein